MTTADAAPALKPVKLLYRKVWHDRVVAAPNEEEEDPVTVEESELDVPMLQFIAAREMLGRGDLAGGLAEFDRALEELRAQLYRENSITEETSADACAAMRIRP